MTRLDLPLPLWQLSSARRHLGAFFVSMALVLVLGAIALMGCQGCGAHPSLPTTPREQARAVVLVLTEGVREADHRCAEAGTDAGDLRLLDRCAAAYAVARSSLLVAAGAVDAWDEGRKGETACATIRGAEAAAELAGLIRSNGAEVPVALEDGLALYKHFGASACSQDGGS